MRYADVIVPLAVEGMYTYTVPVSLESEVREGTDHGSTDGNNAVL